MNLGLILNFPKNNKHICNGNCQDCLVHNLNLSTELKPDLATIQNYLQEDRFKNNRIIIYILTNLLNIDYDYIKSILALNSPLDIILCNDELVKDNIAFLNDFENIYILQNTCNSLINLPKIHYISKQEFNMLDAAFLFKDKLVHPKAVEDQILIELHFNPLFLAKPQFCDKDEKFIKYTVNHYCKQVRINVDFNRKYADTYLYYQDGKILTTPKRLHVESCINYDDDKYNKY